MPSRTASARSAAVILLPLVSLIIACDGRRPDRSSDARGFSQRLESPATYQAEVEEGLGAAVAILVDTSGSMSEKAPGDSRPKYVVAREALEKDARRHRRVRRAAARFFHQGRHLRFFQRRVARRCRSSLTTATPSAPHWGGCAVPAAARRSERRCGTARPDLYRAGVFRKSLLVVTDGENTVGRSPDDVARDIFRKSEGAVQIYFVAFDTDPGRFAFLKDVGGDVIGAGDGAELSLGLDKIYQGRILAEAIDAGEREPVQK